MWTTTRAKIARKKPFRKESLSCMDKRGWGTFQKKLTTLSLTQISSKWIEFPRTATQLLQLQPQHLSNTLLVAILLAQMGILTASTVHMFAKNSASFWPRRAKSYCNRLLTCKKQVNWKMSLPEITWPPKTQPVMSVSCPPISTAKNQIWPITELANLAVLRLTDTFRVQMAL